MAGQLPTAAPRTRLHALDGLRGAAAGVVLLHHCLLTVPSLALAYYDPDQPAPTFARLLSYTPLHVFWAGTEAVVVFFVLSGVVLTLPFTRQARPTWPTWAAYAVQRVLRLYPPVVVAVAWAALLLVLVPRDHSAGLGRWLDARDHVLSLRGVVKDVLLLDGPSGLLTPLWSLQWEVWFSALLPLYVWFALRLAGPWWVKAVPVAVLVAIGTATDDRALRFLPMFALGALIAPQVDRWRSEPWSPSVGLAAGVTALLACTAPWWVIGIVDGRPATVVAQLMCIAGATLLVVASVRWPTLTAALEHRGVQWLGAVSFSLYLVHEPVVIAAAYLGGAGSWPWAIPVAIVVSLLLAAGFHRLVEVPTIRWSRQAGAAVRSRTASSAGTARTP